MATVVKVSGPIFTPEAHKIIQRYLVAVMDRVSEVGVDDIHNRLDQVLQHPTGFYRSHIRSNRAVDSRIISDSNVVYGPWLEGVSSRNQATRFKGYRTFRLVTQQLKQKAPVYAAGIMASGYIQKLNGGAR